MYLDKDLIQAIKNESNSINKSRLLVEFLFKDKVDKGNNPYLSHLDFVANRMNSDQEKTVGYLHDVLEDTDLTTKDLLELGFSSTVVESLINLNANRFDTYNDYIEALIASKDTIALKVKLADMENNMDLTRIKHPSEKDINRLKEKYEPNFNKIIKALEEEK